MKHLQQFTVYCCVCLTSLTSASGQEPSHHSALSASYLDCTDSQRHPAKGAVLIAHGLNQLPETMRPLAAALNTAGFHSCLLRLSRHRKETGCKEQVALSIWRSEYRKAVLALAKRYPDSPLQVIGFSLGSALTVDFLLGENTPTFEAAVLLAPPLSITWGASAVRLLLPFRYFGLGLPSIAPEQYRACSTTSLRSYHAVIRLVDEIQDHSLSSLDTPLRIYIRPGDRIVNNSGVRLLLQDTVGLDWEIYELAALSSASKLPAHLMIDPPSIGESLWPHFINQLTQFFEQHS